MIKKTDIDYRLDDLLILWHNHTAGYKLGRGYSAKDGTCRDYRAPGHYDWQNGAAEARGDELAAEVVNEAMECVPNTPHRWHTALATEARNLATGVVVWRNPVLPQNREELEVLTMEARNKLFVELRRLGGL